MMSGQSQDPNRKLSPKQRAFVEHYLACWNASEAARRAGYKSKPNVIGSQLLAIPSIKRAVDDRLADLQMQADEILARFTDQARGSMADFIDPAGGFISLTKAETAGKLHLVKSFSRSVGEHVDTVKIELYDAQAALAHLARIRGMYVDKIAPTDPSGKEPYRPISSEEMAEAAKQLAAWRQSQAEMLNTLSAAATRPTSSTPAA